MKGVPAAGEGGTPSGGQAGAERRIPHRVGQGRGFTAETAGLQTLHSGWRSSSSGCESTAKGCRGWGWGCQPEATAPSKAHQG